MRVTRLILPGVAGALALLLVGEWLWPAADPPPPPPPAIPSPATEPGGDAAIAQWANTILARPIFNQNRRPANVAAVMVSDAPPPRLSAIIIASGSRRAIFASPGGKLQLVDEGGEIGAYRLRTINANSVDVLGPDGDMTLRLQYLTASAENAGH